MTRVRAHDPFSPHTRHQDEPEPDRWPAVRESLGDELAADFIAKVETIADDEEELARVAALLGFTKDQPADAEPDDEAVARVREWVYGELGVKVDLRGLVDDDTADSVQHALLRLQEEGRQAFLEELASWSDADLPDLVETWLVEQEEGPGDGDTGPDLDAIVSGTAAEVLAWADSHPKQLEALAAAETAGRARKLLLADLQRALTRRDA